MISFFFEHPVYQYGIKEDLIVRLELNSSEKVILCTGDTSATYKLLDISWEYVAICDEPYATGIGEMFTGTTSIPCTKVTSIHKQTMLKKDTTWKIDENNLSVRHCKIYYYYSLINGMTLPTRMKNFITRVSKKFW